MDQTNSIAEGVFAFKPKEKKNSKKRKPQHEFESLKADDWYESYEMVWSSIEKRVDAEESKVISDLMTKVNSYAHSVESNSDSIPTIIMLAGVNMSDHKQLFKNIDDHILAESDSFTATLWASDCPNVRNMIECMVMQFETTHEVDSDHEEFSDEDSDSEESRFNSVKRSNQTLPFLVNWYNNLSSHEDEKRHSARKRPRKEKEVKVSPRLIVILPDFEAHNEKVLQDFILILSGYASKLPFVLMFGVASMISAVHDSLPSHVIAKLSFEFFKSPPSINFLNSMIDSVFLTPDCPFMFSGKVFKFLTDVFLYYDFSLKGFIRAMKFCVMDHFFGSSVTQYCWPRKDLFDVINSLKVDQISELKKVPSFVEYVSKHNRQTDQPPIKTKSDFQKHISDLLNDLHQSIQVFYIGLHCLRILVHDLPQKPLGSELRELYIKAMTSRVIESKGFKECMKALGFTSQKELLRKLDKVVDFLEKHTESFPKVKICCTKVKKMYNKLKNASITSNSYCKSPTKSPTKVQCHNRGDFKKFFEEMRKKQMTDFEIERKEALEFLATEVIDKLLIQLTKLPFHEEFIYNKVSVVKEHMIGAPRGDLYGALNNPQQYLECDCCMLKDQTQILSTMPDICIVYKLHLQWGSLINIYDWMQTFKAVLEPDNDDDNITPEIQARFTQAVADLQFLGYIKHSNAKKDHVARLQFGTAG